MIHPNPDELPVTPITSGGPISRAFLHNGIQNFAQACLYVKHLPYHRNTRKDDPLIVLLEFCGTCSTKHALLQTLALENGVPTRLVAGIFKMNAENSPDVAHILRQYGLPYLPEMHCFLRMGDSLLDFTFPDYDIPDLEEALMHEQEILPHQMGDEKVALHRAFLELWLAAHPEVAYSVDELWRIREACIQAFSEPLF